MEVGMPDEKPQSTVVPHANELSPGAPGLVVPGGQELSFIERKIGEWYTDQPPWLRAFVFFVFVMLFSYSFLRITAGDHAVHGQLFERENHLATNTYDIGVEDRYGTNSQGTYYAVLPPLAYYTMWAK